MLTIYLDKQSIPEDLVIVNDMEAYFRLVITKLTGSKEEREAIKEIDGAEWKEQTSFYDRFGDSRAIDDLSTGSKSILNILNGEPTKVYNLIECGNNAIDQVIKLCRNGNVLLERVNKFTNIDEEYTGEIEVRIGKYVFSTIERLNYYFQKEMNGVREVDLAIKGVRQYVQ